MKYYQVRNKIRGCLRLLLVVLYLVIITSVWVVGMAVMPKTTIGILIVAGIAIACLVAVHHTRGMIP
mgnify:FL=1